MKKILVLALFITFLMTTKVYANDGYALQNPFVKTNFIPRYTDLDYYDVAIPYNLTAKDIGGYVTSVANNTKHEQYNYVTSQDNLLKKQECNFFIQGSSAPLNWAKQGYRYTKTGIKSYIIHDESLYDTFDYDNTGLGYVVKDGVKFYLGAIGSGLFGGGNGYTINEKGVVLTDKPLYNAGGISTSGVFYDLILKSGRQLHFCTSDTMGIGHSVGGNIYGKSKQDGVTYNFSSMNLPQYRNFFHANYPFHMLELVIEPGKKYQDVRQALGINEDPIQYIRIWNGSLHNQDATKVNHNLKELSNTVETPLEYVPLDITEMIYSLTYRDTKTVAHIIDKVSDFINILLENIG